MRHLLWGMAAASLTFLLGVSVATLIPNPGIAPTMHDASQPAGQSSGRSPGRLDFGEVFSGFDFVGSSVSAAECECPHALKESLPFPQRFEAGRMYVFHNRGSINTDSLFQTLESRFGSFGHATTLKGSFFSGMRLHPDTLLFHGNGYAGSVSLESHKAKSKGGRESSTWFVHDFVLTLEMAPQ